MNNSGRTIKYAALMCVGFALAQYLFHAFVFGWTAPGALFTALCSVCGGLFCALILGLLPRTLCRIVSAAFLWLQGLYACVQLVYFDVFGTLMQLSLIKMGGDVAEHFGNVIISTIAAGWYKITAILAPSILLTVCFFSKRVKVAEKGKNKLVGGRCAVLLCLAFAVVCVAVSLVSFGGRVSALEVAKNTSASTEMNYQRLGLMGGALKDLFVQAAPKDSGDASSELDSYFAGEEQTGSNEYTGLLSGYNLVTICGESFCPYFISEELTPALYKLSTQGIIFENYYGTYQSLTSNGEYTLCTGLYPNMQANSGATSFEDSIGNYLPFTLGNSLGKLGYSCYAYHNNVGTFYSRNLSHPNMGYTFRSAGDGLDIKLTNPASDLEMFEQSLADFAGSDKPFHAYYMSYSAHNPYNWTNPMAEKNRAAVENLPYSENVKAYIACNLELEYGLEVLLEKLEETGQADKTVIVITNDHVPYGLTTEEYSELSGMDMGEGFNRFKNAFICYVPGLSENIVVQDYCSTADILPTLLNLFGAEYDPRLLAGTDVFSDGVHMAVLADRSFITEDFCYDASLGLAPDNTAQDSSGLTEADYAELVSERFDFSAKILASDYYRYVYGVEKTEDDAEPVSFSDIQNVFHKSAVQFVVTNNLMDADSDDIFGGDRTATVSELYDIFGRLADGGLTDTDGYGPENELNHVSCAVLMYRFAKSLGKNPAADEALLEEDRTKYPEFSEEELAAVIWASEEAVINKQADFIYENRTEPLTRFQLAAYASYFCTHVLDM